MDDLLVGKTVWLLLGVRKGDNSQVLALGEALRLRGVRVVQKPLEYNSLYSVPNLLLGPTLKTIKGDATTAGLEPAWPDLVVGVGRRSVPVARWIRKRSDGKARLVQIGRPRAPLSWFDLVITTPQYGLPAEENVVISPLPLTGQRADAESVDDTYWRGIFADLPRPWTILLVGGSSAPYRYTPGLMRQLMVKTEDLVAKQAGSLLVSTSPRTPTECVDALEGALSVMGYIHRFSAQGANPHRFMLANGDRFVVTPDSISMISEACSSGKPVQLFQIQPSGLNLRWRTSRFPGRWLAASGLLGPPRDLGRVHHALVANGDVSWLGDEPTVPQSGHRETMDRTIERISILLER